MSERNTGFTVTGKGLVAVRNDGKVLFFENYLTKYKDIVEKTDGPELQEGDDLYLLPSNWGAPINLRKYKGKSVEEQFELYRQTKGEAGEDDLEYLLAKGKLEKYVNDHLIGEPEDRNIFIKRKKKI